MKVRELIEKLQMQPQDADVIIDMECGCFPGNARSVHIPGLDGKPTYGSHTGIQNGKDVVISTEENA